MKHLTGFSCFNFMLIITNCNVVITKYFPYFITYIPASNWITAGLWRHILRVPSGHLSPLTDFHNIWCAWRLIPEGNSAVIFNRRLQISADRLLKYQCMYLITGEVPLKGKCQGKGTGNDHSRTGHEAQNAEHIYICDFSLTSALDGLCGQRHASAALPTGMNRCPFYKELSGPQEWSGRVQKNSPPLGFDARTVHSVASCYTDWAIPDHKLLKDLYKIRYLEVWWPS